MGRLFKYLTPLCWFSCVAVIVAISYIFINLLLHWLLPKDASGANILLQAFGEFLGMLCCLGSLLFPLHPRLPSLDPIRPTRAIQRHGPLLLSFIFLTATIGQILTYLARFPALSVSEFWAKLCFTSEYLFLLGVILSLPTRPLSRATSVRIIFDSLLIVTAVLTFGWYFLLGPIIILHGSLSVWDKTLIAISWFEDLVILCSFLILASRSSDADVQPAKYILLLSIVFLLIGDGLGGYSTLQTGTTDGGGIPGILWGISSALFIISAYYMRFAPSLSTESKSKDDSSGETLPPLWHSLLPSALVPAVIVLVTYVWLAGPYDGLAQGVYLTGALLLAQVILRQVFSLRTTYFSAQKLRLMQQELQAKNHSLGEANRQLQAQTQQIEQAYEQQRHLNEQKDQFLLHMNHELRTPLAIVGTALELLEAYHELLGPVERAEILKEARVSQEELADLISQILDTSKMMSEIPQPQLEAICLHQLIHEVLAHLPSVQINYTIYVQVPEQFLVWADPQFLSKILQHLLSNIFKYVPVQTEIHIEVTQEAPSSLVHLSVQDAGPGIPADELPRLFGKFVRLQRDVAGPKRGTGLGLYICKLLVEAMEGHIWVESSGREGEGSCFCITLPSPLSLPETFSENLQD